MAAEKTDSPASTAFALIAVIVAALAIGAALYERSVARRLQTAMVTASRAYGVAQRIARSESRSAEPPAASRPAGPGPSAAGSPGPSAGNASARPAPSLAEQKADWQNFLTQHPEVRGLLSDYAKHEFAMEFADFCQRAGFTSPQSDQLESMTFEKWFAGLAIGPQGGIRQTGGDLLPPVEQLRGILGDEGAAKLQDFNRTLPAESVASQIAAKAGLMSAPLSSDQAAQLAQVMVANSPEYAAGRGVNLPTVDWTAALSQASAFLSPAQLQAAERHIAGLQYQNALSQARQAAGGPK